MNATMKNAPEREEIESLLPWYAAGTLSRRDTARVEDALSNDAELARRFGRRELAKKPILLLLEAAGVETGRATQTISARPADAPTCAACWRGRRVPGGGAGRS